MTTPIFDHARFFDVVEAIRESQGIDSIHKLATTIDVPSSALYSLRDGKGITQENLVKIIAWSKLDIRSYITQKAA